MFRTALTQEHNLEDDDACELNARVEADARSGAHELSAELTWLRHVLFPRLVSLVARGAYVSPLVHWRAPAGEELVSMHAFAARYQALKEKYAEKLIEVRRRCV